VTIVRLNDFDPLPSVPGPNFEQAPKVPLGRPSGKTPPGKKVTLPHGKKVTPLPGKKVTPLPGKKVTPLPGKKFTPPGGKKFTPF
jgi:hypothetical protein